MSIYPVKLSKWFPPGDELHHTMKFLVSNGYGDQSRGCLHWQQAIGHHSLPWGYGDLWCREKCYRNYRKKKWNKK